MKTQKTDGKSTSENSPIPVEAGNEPMPEQLKPANEMIGQEMLDSREKKRGRPRKDSAQKIFTEPEQKPAVKYPDPTPETNIMAETMVKTLCGLTAMALGDHCAYDPSRDSMMVDAWSRYFSFKGFADFPPIYVALGATAIYATRVITDPKTKENLGRRRATRQAEDQRKAQAVKNYKENFLRKDA
jgi:hypothetical protein